MRIGLDEARAYWSHPSQHDYGHDESVLNDNLVYYANDGVCLAFEGVLVPGFVAVHIGAKPEAWGRTEQPVRALLHEFWGEYQPRYITAWIEDHKRHAVALARRVGFERLGEMPGVLMFGWRP